MIEYSEIFNCLNETENGRKDFVYIVIGHLYIDWSYELHLPMIWMAAARGTINRANANGESGNPCFVPQWSVKHCEIVPFVITVAVGELYKINPLNKWLHLSSVENKNVQLTWSNAFLVSNDKITVLVLAILIRLNRLNMLFDEFLL